MSREWESFEAAGASPARGQLVGEDDVIFGDGGADIFTYSTIDDGTVDTILDFNVGEGDVLDIADILDGDNPDSMTNDGEDTTIVISKVIDAETTIHQTIVLQGVQWDEANVTGPDFATLVMAGTIDDGSDIV